MNRRVSVLAALAVGLGFTAFAVAEESVESVEKKITEALSKHKSLRIKDKSLTDMETPEFKLKTEAESVMEYARRPESKWVSRIESKTRMVRKIQDQAEEKEDGKMLTVCDGQFVWLLTESAQMKTAMKNKLDPKQNYNPFDGKGLFELLKKHYDLKVLPDETVNGKETYVIEARMKKTPETEANPGMNYRAVTCYDKKTGVALKSTSYDDKGKVISKSEAVEVQTDPSIADDRFVFKAPEGVTVMDMTQYSQQEQTGSAGEAKADKAADEGAQAKKDEPKTEKKEDKPKEEKPKEEKKDDATKPLKGLLKGLK